MGKIILFIYLVVSISHLKSFSKSPFLFKKGTTIISIIKNDTVWLAADSRTTTYLPDGKKKLITQDKIKNIENYYYAVAGISQISNKGKDILNTDEIMGLAIKRSSHPNQIPVLFDRILNEKFQEVKNQIAELTYQELRKNKLNINIVCIHNGRPKSIAAIWLFTKINSKESFVKESEFLDSEIVALGENKNIEKKHNARNFKLNLINNIESFMVELIKTESKVNNTVGMPAYIVKLSGNKASKLKID